MSVRVSCNQRKMFTEAEVKNVQNAKHWQCVAQRMKYLTGTKHQRKTTGRGRDHNQTWKMSKMSSVQFG